MKNHRYRKLALGGIGAVVLVCSLAFAGTAAAATYTVPSGTAGCGWTNDGQQGRPSTLNAGDIVQLSGNVGPCGPAAADGAAIKINASNGTSTSQITLDLNGYSVSGCTSPLDPCNTAGVPPSAAYVTGEGPGILVNNSTYVEVKNGTVADFDSGIVIHGGDHNKVSSTNVQNNIGTALSTSSYGEGIGIYLSSSNTITHNTVDHNGPYGGIAVYKFSPDNTGLSTSPTATADGNTIGDAAATSRATCASSSRNTVTNSNVAPNGTTFQDDGIRLEPRVNSTVVACNTVSGSSLEGVAVFADSTGTFVRYNDVTGNGSPLVPLPTQRKGDGIAVFQRANGCTVAGNTVTGNAGNGIRVDALNCAINDNSATNNAFNAGVPGTPVPDPRGAADPESQYAYYDLRDGQTDKKCGNVSPVPSPPGGSPNHWGNLTANTFSTPNPLLPAGSGGRNRNPAVTGYADCIA